MGSRCIFLDSVVDLFAENLSHAIFDDLFEAIESSVFGFPLPCFCVIHPSTHDLISLTLSPPAVFLDRLSPQFLADKRVMHFTHTKRNRPTRLMASAVSLIPFSTWLPWDGLSINAPRERTSIHNWSLPLFPSASKLELPAVDGGIWQISTRFHLFFYSFRTRGARESWR